VIPEEFSVTISEQFFWGLVGSLAVEVVKVHWFYGAARRLPLRYRDPVFWIARSLLALTGGGLAVAYRIETPVLALHLGAATPLIVQALAQNVGRVLAQDDEKSAGVATAGKKPAAKRGVCPRCRRQKPKVTRSTKSRVETPGLELPARKSS
jgi:hypothetical protein